MFMIHGFDAWDSSVMQSLFLESIHCIKEATTHTLPSDASPLPMSDGLKVIDCKLKQIETDDGGVT